MKIITNEFAKRQTRDSRFSHFDGTWEALEEMVWWNWECQREGYRPGVKLVTVPHENFSAGVITLRSGDQLIGRFEPRQDGESPRKVITAPGKSKAPAKSVSVVVYASEVLAETSSNQLSPEHGNWEIVSINASPELGEMPINPEALMHNHFGSCGGTATKMSDAEFVEALREAFVFWRDKAMCEDGK